jgi:hypothetical protein
LTFSQSNNNDKKSRLNETFLGLVVIGVITLIAALYKFNAAKEWVETKKSESVKNAPVQREKFVDKYVNDYAEGAAWALKNEIADPEACNESGTSSIENLGCMAVAAELRNQVEREVSRGMSRSQAEDVLESELLSPEEAMYSEAYLEPEIN